MARVICFIDGFNLYHVLNDCHPSYCKWCNYKELAMQFVFPNDTLEDVFYFTALAKWNKDKVARHEIFIRAQKHFGVSVVLGNFKKKHLKCRSCQQIYLAHEEKESDVNLAVKMVVLAFENKYDKALIVSCDSDFVSTINFIKNTFPSKRIGAIIPFNPRKPHIANHIRQTAHFSKNIEQNHLFASRMPDKIVLQEGGSIECPPEYLMPTVSP